MRTKYCEVCHLSTDLIIEILFRLPVKSLLRFRSVCKKWNDIITSRSFMLNHYHHESNHPRLLAYWAGHDSSDFTPVGVFSLFVNESLDAYEELDNLKLPGPLNSIWGPCNGIFCVSNSNNKLALWNPSIGRMRPLPSPPEVFVEELDEIGFGVDPSTNEFKIVLIHGERRTYGNLNPYFAVYRSSNDTWRYVENEALLDSNSFVSMTQCGTTFIKGCFYWKKHNMTTSNSVILAFDMHNEVFQEIDMPEVVRPREKGFLDLYNLNHQQFRSYCPVGFWKRELIVFARDVYILFSNTANVGIPDEAMENDELLIYNPISHYTRILRVAKSEGGGMGQVWMVYYKESLIPVKDARELQDYDLQSDVSREFYLLS